MDYISIIAQKDLLIAEQNGKIATLEARLAELSRLIFGAKSERFVPLPILVNQLSLFDVGESPTEVEEPQKEQITYERTKSGKKHPGRNEIPEHFPVEEVIIEPEEDTSEMIRIGEEITEYVEYTPGSLKKIKIIRPKYVSKSEDRPVVIAPLPERAFPKSIAGMTLVAWIMSRKFVEHMPFYRQIQSIKREYDWAIPSSTLNDWFATTSKMLEPLYNRLKQKILESGYVQADESPIQVLDENKKGSSHRGYQWVYYSPEAKLVFFDYQKGRGQDGPKQVLADYTGLVQSDGYKVYDIIAQQKGITIAACLVHVRRYFYKAKENDSKRSEYALGIFNKIYQIESDYKEHTTEERQKQRKEHIRPLLVEMKSWVEEECIKVTPRSPMGKAMEYFQSQWPRIEEIFTNGRYELDNNLIENKIRPLALGRKNYLFAGSHEAAQRIAMMYSFFGSCAANDVNPMKWLTYVLENINDTKLPNLDQLLPHNSEP